MAGPADLSPRRREILDAAIKVLAAQGFRGLTHRAIDREAGLPEGSSSAYYRSRSVLHTALASYVVDQLSAQVSALGDHLAARPGDHEYAVEAVSTTFRRWLRRPELLTARLELTLAATRDPALADVIASARADLTEVVEDILERSGKQHDPATTATVVAALDGVLISALGLPAARRKEFVIVGLDLLLGTLVPDA